MSSMATPSLRPSTSAEAAAPAPARSIAIRLAGPSDYPTLASMLAADADHAGTAPEFFFEPGSDLYCVEDERGPVLYLRLSRALRIDVQFRPGSSAGDRMRTARVLAQGMPWLERQARDAGFKELIFTSLTRRLIRFCEGRLGLRLSPHEYRKAL